MEPEFELGQTVVIPGSNRNGRNGRVIGRWEELGGKMRYEVRYFDDDGCGHTMWFFALELEPVPESAG